MSGILCMRESMAGSRDFTTWSDGTNTNAAWPHHLCMHVFRGWAYVHAASCLTHMLLAAYQALETKCIALGKAISANDQLTMHINHADQAITLGRNLLKVCTIGRYTAAVVCIFLLCV